MVIEKLDSKSGGESDHLIDFIIEMEREEKWSPGLYDVKCYLDGKNITYYFCMIAGKPVGMISIVENNLIYFIGSFIVAKAYRGQGYGRLLWDAVVEVLGDKPLGLYAVFSLVPFYARQGFRAGNEVRRFALTNLCSMEREAYLDPLTDAEKLALYRFDQQCTKSNRRDFLSSLLEKPSVFSSIVFDGASPIGYGIVRPAFDHFRVGPLYAVSAGVALSILSSLIGHLCRFRGEEKVTVLIDVPTRPLHPSSFSAALRVEEVGVFPFMVRNTCAEIPTACYGLTALEGPS